MKRRYVSKKKILTTYEISEKVSISFLYETKIINIIWYLVTLEGNKCHSDNDKIVSGCTQCDYSF